MSVCDCSHVTGSGPHAPWCLKLNEGRGGRPTMSDRPNRVRMLCEHCGEVIDVQVPRVGEDMASKALEDFARAILEARLVHAIMECAALTEAPDVG